MIQPFNIASIPNLYFGVGKINTLSNVTSAYGSRMLLITGAKSFRESPYRENILEQLQQKVHLINSSLTRSPLHR